MRAEQCIAQLADEARIARFQLQRVPAISNGFRATPQLCQNAAAVDPRFRVIRGDQQRAVELVQCFRMPAQCGQRSAQVGENACVAGVCGQRAPIVGNGFIKALQVDQHIAAIDQRFPLVRCDLQRAIKIRQSCHRVAASRERMTPVRQCRRVIGCDGQGPVVARQCFRQQLQARLRVAQNHPCLSGCRVQGQQAFAISAGFRIFALLLQYGREIVDDAGTIRRQQQRFLIEALGGFEVIGVLRSKGREKQFLRLGQVRHAGLLIAWVGVQGF